MPDLIVPTVHLNGSGKDSLLEEYVTAIRALAKASASLPYPNGRDYYPQGGEATRAAIEQHQRWAAALNAVRTEVEAVAEKISDQRG